jgi:hypothetical protein
MKQTQQQRKSVLAWRQKLLALDRTVDTGDVVQDLRELHALDIAMIESGIYGLLAQVKELATHEIVHSTLHDILASSGKPAHWRNREGRSQPPENPASMPSSSSKKR